MDQDNKLITEAYRSMRNRGSGKHGEGLTAIEEIQIDLQEAEHRASEAFESGDDAEGNKWQDRADELQSELRSLSLMRRNLRREAVDDETQDAWVQRDTDELEALNKDPEDPMEAFDSLLDGVIAEVEDQSDPDDPHGMNRRRQIGDLMVERIYRKLMGINSATGYTHQGRVFGHRNAD